MDNFMIIYSRKLNHTTITNNMEENKMDMFERLNRETQEFNNRNVNRFSESTPKYGTSTYWQNYWNNQIYKQNNGQYSSKYY